MKAATIVPVAFPIIAGAGSMTSILSLRAEYDQLNITIAILLNMAMVFLVLNFLGRLENYSAREELPCLEKCLV